MDVTARLEGLYLVTATALISHEIDSAYWQEWQLFHLTGGIQLFVLLHLLLIPAVFYGYREICRRGSRTKLVSLTLASVGVFTALMHGTFLLTGDRLFTLPVSQALLLVILVVSLFQLSVTLRLHE